MRIASRRSYRSPLPRGRLGHVNHAFDSGGPKTLDLPPDVHKRKKILFRQRRGSYMKFAKLAVLLAVALFADMAAAQCPGGRCSTMARPARSKAVRTAAPSRPAGACSGGSCGPRRGFFGRLFGR